MPKKQTKAYPSDSHKDQSQWVMLMPDSCSKGEDGSSPKICKLRHPKTDEAAMFLFSADNQQIFEVLQFSEKYRSWFIEETVQSGADDIKVFRFDKDKTLAWLKAKVDRLSTVLTEKKIHTSMTGSSSATYVKSIKSTGGSTEDTMRFAHGMVSEYLPVSLSKDLRDHLGIKDVVVHEKPEIEEPTAKRSKKDIAPTEDYSKQNGDHKKSDKTCFEETTSKYFKLTRTTLAQKKLEKVDKSGMKNIASFFSPKGKK